MTQNKMQNEINWMDDQANTDAPAAVLYLSMNVNPELMAYLQEIGYGFSFTHGIGLPVDPAIRSHADIALCKLGVSDDAEIFRGNTKLLGAKYPDDAIYNAVCTGKFLIHKLNITQYNLMKAVRGKYPHIMMIDVPQGYTRCNLLPVDEKSFITSDAGIAKAIQKFIDDIPQGATDLDGNPIVKPEVLLIEPGHIELTGHDYGFIGGCAGHIKIDGEPAIIFHGNLSAHPDFEKIRDFIESRGVKIKYFDSFPLEDIGSIL